MQWFTVKLTTTADFIGTALTDCSQRLRVLVVVVIVVVAVVVVLTIVIRGESGRVCEMVM